MTGLGNRYKFRVHSSLAAYYKISYRGAYSTTQLEPHEILELAEVKGNGDIEQEIERVVRQVTERRTGKGRDPAQTELFGSEG